MDFIIFKSKMFSLESDTIWEKSLVNIYTRENNVKCPLRTFPNSDYMCQINKPRYLQLEKLNFHYWLQTKEPAYPSYDMNDVIVGNDTIKIPEMTYELAPFPGGPTTKNENYTLESLRLLLTCSGARGIYSSMDEYRESTVIWSAKMSQAKLVWFQTDDNIPPIRYSAWRCFDLVLADLPGPFQLNGKDLVFTWLWQNEYGQTAPVDTTRGTTFNPANPPWIGYYNQNWDLATPWDLTFSISTPKRLY